MRYARIVLCALVFPLTVAAQDPADPPARVARVSYIEGSVSLRSESAGDWSQAALNYPITSGNYLWTDDGARSELQVGSTTLQLASQTALQTTTLDDQHTQLSITQGSMTARVRELSDNQVAEFDTPAGAVSLVRPGDLRVDVSPDGQITTVTVWHGEAEMTSGSATFPIPAGNTVVVGSASAGTYDLHAARAPDSFDEWCQARDQRQDNAASARYVSREMTGYADLDAYGNWRVIPTYGRVWVPVRVAPGWAPYRYGHWAFVRPWGWTWVDDAPWGFAPFHYGRWAYWRGSWVWAPGRVVARPVYAPALVAFVGGPGWHVSVGIGGGAVGWFPLAPGEVYFPSYRASRTYVRNVNLTSVHVTNINVTNVNVRNVHYANRSVAGAVTAVPRNAFAWRHSVGQSTLRLPQHELASAPVLARGASISPRRPLAPATPSRPTAASGRTASPRRVSPQAVPARSERASDGPARSERARDGPARNTARPQAQAIQPRVARSRQHPVNTNGGRRGSETATRRARSPH